MFCNSRESDPLETIHSRDQVPAGTLQTSEDHLDKPLAAGREMDLVRDQVARLGNS